MRPLTPATKPLSPSRTARARYWVELGPAGDLDQLGRLADRLVERHGIVGRVQTGWVVRAYQVRSTPVRTRKAAEQRRRLLDGLGLPSSLVEQPDGTYVLDFGRFADVDRAERTARAVRARGYGAQVVPLRVPSYTLAVGPVSEAAAVALARTLQADGVPFTLTRR